MRDPLEPLPATLRGSETRESTQERTLNSPPPLCSGGQRDLAAARTRFDPQQERAELPPRLEPILGLVALVFVVLALLVVLVQIPRAQAQLDRLDCASTPGTSLCAPTTSGQSRESSS